MSAAKRNKLQQQQLKGKHWSENELRLVMDLIKKILPRGNNDWVQVAEEYNLGRPAAFFERTVDSIRNKFKALRNVRKPTGDPTIPHFVKVAKHIQRDIEQRISTLTVDDEEELDDDEGEDDNVNEEEEEDGEEFASVQESLNFNSPSDTSSNKGKSSSSSTTTLRTGLSEEELIKLGKRISVQKNVASIKRSKLDTSIEKLSDGKDFMQLYLLQQEERAEKEEHREREREREREEKERIREEREREREEREREREERREERQRQHDILMATFLTKLLDNNK